MAMRHVKVTTSNGDETEGYVFRDDGNVIGLQTPPQRIEIDIADVANIEPLSNEHVEPKTAFDEAAANEKTASEATK